MWPTEPRAGELSHRIMLRVWSEIPNAEFSLDQTFGEGLPLWAKHEAIHGLVMRQGVQTGEAPTDLFWIRSSNGTRPEDITGSHVVEWKNRRYRVVDALSVGVRGDFTRITAKDIGGVA